MQFVPFQTGKACGHDFTGNLDAFAEAFSEASVWFPTFT